MASAGDLYLAAIRYARAEGDEEFALARRCLAELAVKVKHELPPNPPVLVATASFTIPQWNRMIEHALTLADAHEHVACHEGCCACPSFDEAMHRFLNAADRWADKAKWVLDPWRTR